MTGRIGRKGAKYANLSSRTGLTTNPGPFVGFVKNNLDPTRAGRLQVYIPELGGADPDDPTGWFTVNYTSPFRGQTVPERAWTYETAQLSTEESGMQSYGMWFTPPNIGIKVLCFFANGDPSQGYYVGTIMDSFDSHMIPAIGASFNEYEWDPNKFASQKELAYHITNPDGEIPFRLPVTEAPYDKQQQDTFASLKRAPHVYQSTQLGKQGLAFDFIRGSTSASSVRESPSQVFGISTPGRLYSFKDVTTSQDTLDKITAELDKNSESIDPELEKKLKNINRIGGHSFVMDDGTVQGNDSAIRIRTSKGNMILLDDTNEQIYIVNARGTAWIEMSPSGRIDVYSLNDFSIRSQGNINFHADKDINLHAGGRINQYAANSIRMESQGKISINSASQVNVWGEKTVSIGTKGNLVLSAAGQASIKAENNVVVKGETIQLNSNDGAPNAEKPEVLGHYEHASVDYLVRKDEPTKPGVWWSAKKFKSIVPIAPAHEPWPTHEVNGIKARKIPTAPKAESVPQETKPDTSSNPGDIAAQPIPGDGVCGLTQGEFRSLLTTLGKKESGGKFPKSGPPVLNQQITSQYTTYNKYGYVGKYQFGAAALEECGYIKKGSYAKYQGASTGAEGMNNRNWKVLMDPNNWAKSSINSVQAWLSNDAEQEAAMETWMKIKCKELTQLGVIDKNTPHPDIGGYLMVAHLNGPGKAVEFKNNPNASTAGPNASIQSYFRYGQAAIKQAGDTGLA